MLNVGYNDRQKCFIIRNSWGTSWGDRGYAYVPYDYICNSDFNFLGQYCIIGLTDSDFTPDPDDGRNYNFQKDADVESVSGLALTSSLVCHNPLYDDLIFQVIAASQLSKLELQTQVCVEEYESEVADDDVPDDFDPAEEPLGCRVGPSSRCVSGFRAQEGLGFKSSEILRPQV